MEYYSYIATIASLYLLGIGILYYVKIPVTNLYFVPILFILLQLWLADSISMDIIISKLFLLIFSSIFLGPLMYLYTRKILIKQISRRLILINLFIPFGLLIFQIYNFFMVPDDAIQITIITNMIGALLSIVYGLILIFLLPALNLLSDFRERCLLILLSISVILLLIIPSIVSMISALYFTDQENLVKLSVEVPKLYDSNLKFWMLLMATCLAGIFGIYHIYKRKRLLS